MDFKVIAVDFDGTLCENKWPEIGKPNLKLFDYLKDQQEMGAKIILRTCRTGDELSNAIEWCHDYGLYFDEVNRNVEESIKLFGEDTRKIFAHEYIDDRAKNVKTKQVYIVGDGRYQGFESIKTQAIRAAKDLCYKKKYIDRLANAKTEGEVQRIMITARKEKFGD